jgi:cobalt-zinc-cadmium efflux system membrane fusion protein
MHVPYRRIGFWVRSQATNLIVFAVLGSILFLGHHFDWKIPRASAKTSDTRPTLNVMLTPTPKLPTGSPSAAEATKAGDKRIRFANPETLAKSNIKAREVASMPFPEYVVANGSIDYVKTRMAQLSTRAPGVVWQVLAKVGDYVKESDTLAIVESVDVGKAKSDFLQAVVQFELKEKILSVSKNLDSVIARKEIVELESRLREARIQKVNAQQTLINLGLPIDINEYLGLSDEELVRKLHTLGLPDTWAPKFDPARTTANLVPLKAPFAGQVIGTDLVKGEAITPGQAKVVIANTEAMWIVLDVGIEDAFRVRLGQEIVFRPDGFHDQEVASTVSWISTEADPKTRRVQVRAEVKNPTGALRANTFGAGKVKVREEPNALAVPNEGLHWDLETKTHLVFVSVDGQSFDPRPVRLGARTETMTEVFGELRAGDRIAVEGSYLLKSELLRVRMASTSR